MATVPVSPAPTPLSLPRPWYRRWWGVALLAGGGLVTLALIAFIGYVWHLSRTLAGAEAGSALAAQWREPGPYADVVLPERPFLGSPEATVTIVEFLDFNCPVCKASYPIIREVTSQFGERIHFSIRHYPVIAESSPRLALASECAHDQGKFWNLHDRLHQSRDPNGQLLLLARQSGLDMPRFERCLEDETFMDRVEADRQAALEIGARGTPTFVINGHRIDGGLPKELFVRLIEELLKNNP